jgi:hypothetical protein
MRWTLSIIAILLDSAAWILPYLKKRGVSRLRVSNGLLMPDDTADFARAQH